MLKIAKNNFLEWELLLRVLSGELSESDPEFQRWLKEDIENKTLYMNLKGKGRKSSIAFDKDKVFDRISDMTGLYSAKKISFYKKRWFTYAVSILILVSVGLTGYFIRNFTDVPESYEIADNKKNIFEPGSKKAYLVSSQGENIDLSEDFELKNDDGTIISNKSEGVVSFQQRATRKKKVEMHTIYVPKSGEYELLLADGSKVFLNSESSLVFPSYFDGESRTVELTGEAYFEVVKGDRPFIVKTDNMDIEVLGTSFNVNAYLNNPSVHTTLVEGSVQVHVADNPETYFLSPDNNFNMERSSGKVSIQKVNTEVYTAWVKGEFIFRNQSLHDIFTQLTRWYDFEIEYEKTAIQHMRFTGSAEKIRPLDYLLNQIQTVTDVKYRSEGDKIILY